MFKLKKAIISAMAALALAFGLCVNALGATENFARLRQYDGRFADVPETSWYYENVASLYEMGLTNGQSEWSYGATNPVTLAEAVSFAARIHSIYKYGEDTVPQAAEPWYQGAVDYLKEEGALTNEYDGRYAQYATRAEVAGLMAKALPASEMRDINGGAVIECYMKGTYLKDVNEGTPNTSSILALYSWGVLEGSDDSGAFRPYDRISRSELAAILTRLVDPDLRMLLNWDMAKTNKAEGFTYASMLKGDRTYRPDHLPDDMEAVRSNINYMIASGSNTIRLKLPRSQITKENMQRMADNYLEYAYSLLEQGYTGYSLSYTTAGDAQIRFSAGKHYTPEETENLRVVALSRAVGVHDSLWQSGRLTGAMTQQEIARVYFEWVAENCAYDETSSPASHQAFGLFVNGKAVCDGYVAAYNMFLKMEGIDCAIESTDSHVWTVATLDGVTYHIDPTWGDGGPEIQYKYFCMSPEQSWARFQ